MSILFKGNLEEGNYTLIKSTDGWVLKGETSYAGFNFADRPQGEWELVPCADLSEYFKGVKHGFRFRCSNCKDKRKRNKHDMNYCPNCGAQMKGADDE